VDKNRNFREKSINFRQEYNFLRKIKISDENRTLCKNKRLTKKRNFRQKVLGKLEKTNYGQKLKKQTIRQEWHIRYVWKF